MCSDSKFVVVEQDMGVVLVTSLVGRGLDQADVGTHTGEEGVLTSDPRTE